MTATLNGPFPLEFSLSGVSDGLHPARIWTPERVACAWDASWSKLTRFVLKTHHDITRRTGSAHPVSTGSFRDARCEAWKVRIQFRLATNCTRRETPAAACSWSARTRRAQPTSTPTGGHSHSAPSLASSAHRPQLNSGMTLCTRVIHVLRQLARTYVGAV
jgi:hypothetical protein